MPIINIPPLAPRVLTNAQAQVKVRLGIKSRNTQLFNQMVSTFTQNMASFWQNPDGLTPQQVCDAFGTDAGALVTLAAALKDLINSTQAGTVTATAPGTLTVNSDGTVTVS